MKRISLSEAKQKLSELVERASRGERIGITRRGKLAAQIVPAGGQVDVKHVFKEIEKIRKGSKNVRGVSIKSLIEEGRT